MIEIEATFIGKDGSCGFRNGKTYDLWYFEKNKKIYISHRSLNAMAIPYDTMNAFRKNWTLVAKPDKRTGTASKADGS